MPLAGAIAPDRCPVQWDVRYFGYLEREPDKRIGQMRQVQFLQKSSLPFTSLSTMKKSFSSVPFGQKFSSLFFFLAFACGLFGQASLSVQGVLTKSDGTAVDDGDYQITFKLYPSSSGGSVVFSETITTTTIGGVYSVILGQTEPLTAPFDQIYYLGVSVGGGQELTPRPPLTHAPYALSLLGQNNKFPSLGMVFADSITVAGAAKAGAMVSGSGAPAANTAGKGYSFDTGGDADGGLFSTANGTVSVYTNAAERVKVTDSQVELISGDLKLNSGKSIKYGSLPDWRLVDVDDFDNGIDGWTAYSDLSPLTPIANGVRVISTSSCFPLTDLILTRGNFGSGEVDEFGRQYIIKSYNVNTPHTKIKVVYTFGSCGPNGADSYKVRSRAGENLSDIKDYEELYNEDPSFSSTSGGRQKTREIILNTASNTFAFGFYIDGYDVVNLLPQPVFIDWYLDNIEVWVK